MNFVADESVDRPIVDRLRQEGHQVWYVAEMEEGISERVVLNQANQNVALFAVITPGFYRIRKLI